MFELKHLKTLTTLQATGSIRKAADCLFTSQSALSHQIKDLESRINTELFIRNSSPLKFTPKGLLLLNLAKNILPQVENVKMELKGRSINKSLTIAIKCHACFQWLLPVTKEIEYNFKNINVEFIDTPFTDDDEKLRPADILFTDETVDKTDKKSVTIGEFELVAVLAKKHPLVRYKFLTAEHFIDQTLLTYPVEKENLDIFIHYLTPANVQPKSIKKVSNSHVILQMVAADMGISVLPYWLVKTMDSHSLVEVKQISLKGLRKTLYMRYDNSKVEKKIIKQLIPAVQSAFKQLL